MIEVVSKIGSRDSKEFSRARWSRIAVTPADDRKLIRKRGTQRPLAAAPAPARGTQGHAGFQGRSLRRAGQGW